MNNIKTLIGGKYEGTRLEIMPSAPATTLPDGTPIGGMAMTEYHSAQVAHMDGDLDVHAPQEYNLEARGGTQQWVGPSIAQEWKMLARGERPFYRRGAFTS